VKAFSVIFIIFVIIVIVVFQTGYYSHSEASLKAMPVKAETPIHKLELVEPKQPETKIVYVPQVEKVYIKEIHTERVIYHTETPRESYQPVSYNSAPPENYSGCSSFTGEARTNCERTVREGGTAQQYQAKITYYGGIR